MVPEGDRQGVRQSPYFQATWKTTATWSEVDEAIGEATEAGSHLLAVVKRNNAAFRRARKAANPKTGDGHRCPVWWFASELRGHRGFRDLRAYDAVVIVGDLLADHGGWTLLPSEDVWGNEVKPRDEFIHAWSEVEKPLAPVFDPEDALPFAERWPLTCERWPAEEDASYRSAVAVLFWYATILDDDGRFFMSCRKLGDALATSRQTALNYLHRAQDDGLLDLVEPGKVGRAARYRFDLDAITLAGEG